MANLVAIVGRPNVGKSTLFNRLTKTRQAIVSDTAGTTRDRQYGKCEWNGREFSVVDTGGWVVNSDDIFEDAIRKQVIVATEEADVVLFVVDVQTGLTDWDQDVATILRRTKLPVILVANKTDNNDQIYDAAEFYALGLGEPQCISSATGSGTGDLMDEIVRDLPKDTLITQQMVNELMDTNRNKTYSDKQILDVAIQEYKVGNDYENDPAGIQADQLTGNFLNILWRKSFYDKLTNCFDKAGIKIAELDIAPLALADCILDDTRKRAGCMLVDMGAATTTMLVYHKNILRHIAVIPLGSSNITKDIASANIEEDVAEKMKIKYGSAYTELEERDKTMEYSVTPEQTISSEKFQQIVEARIQEIIENVWAQVPTEYKKKLNGGIVITGGGSNMKNITKAFSKKTEIDKINIVQFINDTVTTTKNINLPHDGTLNTLLGLLMKGDQSCDGGEIKTSLFNESNQPEQPALTKTQPTEPNYVAGGTAGVRTPAEIAAAAELQRKQDNDEWTKAVADNTIGAYQSYKEKYPNGLHTEEATKIIEEIQNKESKPKDNIIKRGISVFKRWITEENEE